MLIGEKEVYFIVKDIGFMEVSFRFILDILKMFLRNLCGEINNDLKVFFIG